MCYKAKKRINNSKFREKFIGFINTAYQGTHPDQKDLSNLGKKSGHPL